MAEPQKIIETIIGNIKRGTLEKVLFTNFRKPTLLQIRKRLSLARLIIGAFFIDKIDNLQTLLDFIYLN